MGFACPQRDLRGGQVAMMECNGIEIELKGGPMDGEKYYLGPLGSVAIPNRLQFLSAKNDEAGYETYSNHCIEMTIWETVANNPTIIDGVLPYRYDGFKAFTENQAK
jgi:hypothetical protein